MRPTHMRRGLRSTLALTFVLLGLIAATPLALAGPAAPGAPATPVSTLTKPDSPDAVNSYTLYGDASNAGHGGTFFQTDDTAANNYGWWFKDTRAQDLYAVYVDSVAGTGVQASGSSTGVHGQGASYGLYGSGGTYGVIAYGSTYGVYGSASTYGVYGSGSTYGVYGSGSSYGVYGSSSSGDGVTGKAAAAGQSGVVGTIASTSGAGYGVRGFVVSTSTVSYGGYFTATAGVGLYGRSNSNSGVLGTSTSLYGVRAVSASSYALLATSTDSVGVRGASQTYYGFYGGSISGTGGYGYTRSGQAGFRAHNDTTTAGHYGLISDGDVLVNGDITCSGSCLLASSAKTSAGDKLIYAESAAQSIVNDQGTATLKDGRAVIKIDPLFAQTVSLDGGYQVFLTPASFSSAGLAVGNQSGASFEVRELGGGKGNYSFYWRLTAVRKGYEKTRLENAPQVAPPATEPDVPAFSDPAR